MSAFFDDESAEPLASQVLQLHGHAWRIAVDRNKDNGEALALHP
jgi:hypothetical protein